jgi:hypothetical protein
MRPVTVIPLLSPVPSMASNMAALFLGLTVVAGGLLPGGAATAQEPPAAPAPAVPATPAGETRAVPTASAVASAGGAGAAAVEGETTKIDFSNEEAGDLPTAYMVSDAEAKFTIEDDGGNKLMRMNPSPIVDGGVLVGKSVKGPASVTARVRATGKRRSFPRFGVGLHGVSGYRLLAAPADKELQIMKDDAVVAKVPLEWKSGAWVTFEFTITAAADGGSAVEGRLWENGQNRPAAAQVTLSVKTPPATGKASVWAAPYSGQPVDFDDIAVTGKS